MFFFTQYMYTFYEIPQNLWNSLMWDSLLWLPFFTPGPNMMYPMHSSLIGSAAQVRIGMPMSVLRNREVGKVISSFIFTQFFNKTLFFRGQSKAL